MVINDKKKSRMVRMIKPRRSTKTGILATVIATLTFLILVTPLQAQENMVTDTDLLEIKVEKILEEKETPSPTIPEEVIPYQKLECLITKGEQKGEKIVVETGQVFSGNLRLFRPGDRLVISHTVGSEGKDIYYVTDYVRRKPMVGLLLIFLTLTILVGKRQGVSSLLGLLTTFLIIFTFVLPKIASGDNPALTAAIGALFIIPLTYYLSHGFNKKTTIAIAGTIGALVATIILAVVFIGKAHLTGFSSDEASFLQIMHQGNIDIKGLLLAGIIIGVLGVLDDVTISQAAIVFQLREANPRSHAPEVYHRAMAVGKDHIASMVNTLVLVYAGSSLPLLLLFSDKARPFSEIINLEIVAEEIIRALVGSSGLILAVPLTTLLATLITEIKRPPH